MKKTILLFCAAAAALLCGCYATDNAPRLPLDDLNREGTVVFARPEQFTPLFGNYSISKLFEIVYERSSRNSAGQLVVEVGIRYRGPVSWTDWYVRAPKKVNISYRCQFYNGPVGTPVIYSTNTQKLVLQLGETYACKTVCPYTEASRYQVVFGE